MSLKAESIFDLKGAVALVTGGGTGLGLTAALALASNGAKVYITGRRKEKLDDAVSHYSSEVAGTLVAIQGDVSSKDDLAKVAAEIKKQDGKLHILVNNSGVEGPITKLDNIKSLSAQQYADTHLSNESFEQWDHLLRINTSAVFFATMTFLPLLAEGNKHPIPSQANQGWTSSVINITSISGLVKSAQNHFAYNTSKAAANHLTAMMSHEFKFNAQLDIRVNSIAPGLFATEMTAGKSEKGKTDPNDESLKKHGNPAGRVGSEKEYSGLVLLLASNQFMTGQVVAVDGGFCAAVPSTR